MLLDHVSNVDGEESDLPQLPADASFTGMTPSPAAQLAALSKIAEESVKEVKEVKGKDEGTIFSVSRNTFGATL